MDYVETVRRVARSLDLLKPDGSLAEMDSLKAVDLVVELEEATRIRFRRTRSAARPSPAWIPSPRCCATSPTAAEPMKLRAGPVERGHTLPWLIEPEKGRSPAIADLAPLLRGELNGALLRHGALLFRGFAVDDRATSRPSPPRSAPFATTSAATRPAPRSSIASTAPPVSAEPRVRPPQRDGVPRPLAGAARVLLHDACGGRWRDADRGLPQHPRLARADAPREARAKEGDLHPQSARRPRHRALLAGVVQDGRPRHRRSALPRGRRDVAVERSGRPPDDHRPRRADDAPEDRRAGLLQPDRPLAPLESCAEAARHLRSVGNGS